MQAMKLFPIHFRDEVMPRLRNLVRAEAVCVARGVETFDGAYCAVMAYARRYGALYLANTRVSDPRGGTCDGYEALEDWIATTLLAEIDRAEDAGAP